ncbi:hypothetical protein HAZT_HAZT006980 [Hyalella azteca]|uniref:N-alpha-acetyltransferase 60 n=1 Tax=Hyalella azteca TaxID=294128 RepID=A0A6A0H887_HYAAZ|nr:hypothetical protein HAZT_HAZT006980 [Hyalella azteca]
MQIKELCGDWFPIDYPPFWYECITETDQYYALAALHNSTIIGLLVAQTKPLADMNPEPFCHDYRLKKNRVRNDHQILLHADLHDGNIGYILTLGVRKPYRRLGLATLLLNQYMEHLRLDCHIKLQNFNLTEPKCLGSKTPIDFKASQFPGHSEVSHNDVLQRLRCYSAAHADAPVTAVLLHVLSTNAEAIHFYTRRNFSRLAFLPMFYLIKDSRMDGYSYVFYLNGGEPPTSFFSDPLKSLDLPPSPSLSDFSLVPLKMAGKVARWVLGPDRTRVMSFVVTSFFELMGKMVTSLVGTDNR